MKREIKFRAWDIKHRKFIDLDGEKMNPLKARIMFDEDNSCGDPECCGGPFPYFVDQKDIEVTQFTGLLDKNEPCREVYEGDIVDVHGKIIGNKYETPLVRGDSPIVIEGLGTSAWSQTEVAGLARGLRYAE
jgi:uncharacterized phage protein (TIGR01671 family)